MFTPIDVTDKLLFTTIRIETDVSVGTGFIYSIKIDETRNFLALITNKHVVEGAKTGKLRVHLEKPGDEKTPEGIHDIIVSSNFNAAWIAHPDEEVDLCALPFWPLAIKVKAEAGRNVFFRNLASDFIKSNKELEDLTALEDVLMVGYPNGLWDDVNNLPLLRRGITSSFPSIDFGGKQEGVVDIACFPGSSGSPILIINQGGYIDKKENAINMKGRMILLGVLYAGPIITSEGRIEIKEAPVSRQPVSKTNLMIHLGYYIKASRILELEEYIRKKVLVEKEAA